MTADNAIDTKSFYNFGNVRPFLVLHCQITNNVNATFNSFPRQMMQKSVNSSGKLRKKIAEVDLHNTRGDKLKKSVDETAILKQNRTFSFLWIAHSSRKSKAERDFFHNQLSSELRLQFTTKTI